jgi:hypothetical protein
MKRTGGRQGRKERRREVGLVEKVRDGRIGDEKEKEENKTRTWQR